MKKDTSLPGLLALLIRFDLKALIAVPVAFRFSGALDAESLKDPFQLFYH